MHNGTNGASPYRHRDPNAVTAHNGTIAVPDERLLIWFPPLPIYDAGLTMCYVRKTQIGKEGRICGAIIGGDASVTGACSWHGRKSRMFLFRDATESPRLLATWGGKNTLAAVQKFAKGGGWY